MKTFFILSALLAVLSGTAALPYPQDDTTPITTVNPIPVESTSNFSTSEATQTATTSAAPDLKALAEKELQDEKNKKLVLDFYQTVFGDKDVDAADRFIDEQTYIQHNPAVADGRAAFKAFMKPMLEGKPKTKIDVQRIGGDGDLVYLHLRGIEAGKLASIIDVFRVQNDKIVEHWDVIQHFPEKSANDHPLF